MSSTDRTTSASDIAAALDDPFLASVADDTRTRVTPVHLPGGGAWQLHDIIWRGPHHPHRWLVATRDDRAVRLDGHPELWDAVLEDTRIDSPDDAIALACARADVTRDLSIGHRRLEHADDARFVRARSDEVATRIAQARELLTAHVAPPSVTGEGPWTVTLWTLTGRALVRRDVQVDVDGSAAETTTVVADDLPVPVAR